MQTFTTKTIREIALETPQTTRVFEEFKIDYCCGGRKPFESACLEAGLEPKMVADRIEAVMKDRNAAEIDRTTEQTASNLIDYIISTHHIFTAAEIERLLPLMEKVCQRHGDQHPELLRLRSVFIALTGSLIPHMRKEESVLFPYIQTLDASVARGLSVQPPHFGTVNNPIRMMVEDHEEDGARLSLMRAISNDYSLPDGACPSFAALYAGLQDLEKDLHRHIHLENNVLFPAAAELEKSAGARV